MQQATNTNSAIGATRVSRAHNNPPNYFGNTNAASIFSAIIRAYAKTARASTEATDPSFSLGCQRRTHTRTHVDACVGAYAVADDHGTELESVRIPSRISQTCCLRRPVCLATPYYGLTRLKSIKFDHSSILSPFVSVLKINQENSFKNGKNRLLNLRFESY